MTSKERAKLKSIASKEETILQIGKNPIGETFIKQIRDALRARELIKVGVLETCELLPAEAAQAIAEEVGCEVVQVIGSKAVLFKRRSKGDKKPSYLDEQPKEPNKQSKRQPKTELSSKRDKGKGKKAEAPAPKPYTPKQSRIRSVQKNKAKGSK